jgi:hypothetical protein
MPQGTAGDPDDESVAGDSHEKVAMNHRDLAGHAARATALVALIWNGGAALADSPRFTLEAEVGGAWQQRNDARIDNEPPNTRIDLAELTGDGPYPVGRLALRARLAGRSGRGRRCGQSGSRLRRCPETAT